MAISKITASGVATDTLTAADLAPNSVDSSELVDGSVDLSHMSANSVDSDQYVDGSIDTAHIGDDQVTGDKLANDIAISTTGAITTTGAFTSVGIDDNASGAVAITIDASENVGIGATTVDEILHLESTTTNKPVLKLEQSTNDATSAEIKFVNGQGGGYGGAAGHDLGRVTFTGNMSNGSQLKYAEIYSEVVDPHATTGKDGKIGFKVNCLNTDTEVMTIKASGDDGSGRVGFGGEPLYCVIEGRTNVGNANQSTIGLCPNTTANSGARNWQWKNNQSTWGDMVFMVSASNNTTPNDTTRLAINSDGTFVGSGSNDISDERLKENIETINDALSKINALTGRKFNWIKEAAMDSDTHYGLVAQEVEKIVPELVYSKTGLRSINKTTGKIVETPELTVDGKTDENIEFSKSVQTSGVIPILIEAVKELSVKMDALEARVTALE